MASDRRDPVDPRREGAASVLLQAGLFRAAVEVAEFGVVIADARRPHWPAVYVNPAFERSTGYPASAVLGRGFSILQGADREQPELARLRRALQDAEPVTVTLRNYRRSGELFWNELTVTPIVDDNGQLTHFVGVQHDVTNRVEADSRMIDVLDRVGDAFFAVDRNWSFTYLNRRAQELLGRQTEDLVGRRLWDAFPSALGTPIESNYLRAMKEMSPTTFVEFFPPLAKWFEVRAFPGRDGLSVYFHDITEQRTRESRLKYLATHDMLSGLPNRARCLATLQDWAAAAERGEHALAVLYFDLDGFKDINDSVGHAAGDEVLRQVSARLRSRQPIGSSLARFSGDEFVLLVDSRDPSSLIALAEQIIAAIREPIRVVDRQLRIGASAGIAIYPEAGEKAEGLLVNADLAMLAAKQAGRGRARIFDAKIVRVQRRRMRLMHELRLARFDDQLVAHYQPKLHAEGGGLSGFEALTRWTHPELGPVSPIEFIPLAEESGEISRLGGWVLNTVCRQLRQWIDDGLPVAPVSVNVSVGQIESPDFLDIVDEALATHSVPPSLLQVEITESLLMRDFETARVVIGGLAERGVDVHLDDFGTGYSSLACLWQLPVACIKLDRSFTRGLEHGGGSETVVRSAITLAHALGKTVVAEGVETAEQESMLRGMGCDQLQGFLFSRPVAMEAATSIIRSRNPTFE